MADSKAAGEFIRQLKKNQKAGGYTVTPHDNSRYKVIKDGKTVFIPGPCSRTSGKAIRNARATLRRELGIGGGE